MRRESDKVAFVGLGYVGLCTATVMASKGIRIIGVDIDDRRVEQLRKGQPPFHEPLLQPMLKAALRKKRMEFTTDASQVAEARSTFLTVGTPSNSDGSIDLTYVKKATEDVGSAISASPAYHLVVIKSTVTPGTATDVVRPILEASSEKTCGPLLGLASNPEFLAEGSAIRGTLKPDKIVIGATDARSGGALAKLYRRIYPTVKVPTILTDITTAETIKYASNAFLATRVSTINTIANICQRVPNADVETVAKAIGLDPRIGPLYLKAGPGYGGSCFHKDIQALISFSRSQNYEPILLAAVEEVNQRQASEIVNLSKKLLGSLDNRRVAILGLAFKKDTDDMREAASLRVIDELLRNGARVSAYDPMALENARRILGNRVELMPDAISCLKGADCAIVMTEWDEFRKLGPTDYKSSMKAPNIVDARRIIKRDEFDGFNYLAVGLGTSSSSKPS
jgi:UDPglucose 6-dehydrogenase